MHILAILTLLVWPTRASQQADTTGAATSPQQLVQLHKLADEQTQQISQLNTKMDSLQKTVEELQGSIKFYERTGSLSVIVLSIVGLTAVIGFIKRSTRKFDRAIDAAIFRIDPHDMPIKIPAIDMEKEQARLQRLKFRALSTYQWLDDSCTKNAVVHLATNDQGAEELRKFIQDKGLAEREDVAFVVYTKGARLNPTILSEFDNVTFANTHLTLVQALFVAARGMVR